VQAAAYQLVPAGQLPVVHCRIATQLLSGLDALEQVEFAIEICGHVQTGLVEVCKDRAARAGQASWRTFLSDPFRLSRVLHLLGVAGRLAKSSAAHDSSLQLLTLALRLIDRGVGILDETMAAPASSASPASSAIEGSDAAAAMPDSVTPSAGFLRVSESCWTKAHADTSALYLEVAQCLFLLSQFREAQLCIEYALEHHTTPLARSAWFELHLHTLSQQMLLAEVQRVGLLHLEELGIDLIEAPTPEVSVNARVPAPVRLLGLLVS
jgi:hypothetical protein